MDSARAFCAGVLDLGCALALDDFGAGFGSFQYLKQLPFSHLKIDGDFIRELPTSRTDQLVVRALARIVRGMGRETIAEFVGDEPTIAMLRAYDVDYAQGYQLGAPAPLHEPYPARRTAASPDAGARAAPAPSGTAATSRCLSVGGGRDERVVHVSRRLARHVPEPPGWGNCLRIAASQARSLSSCASRSSSSPRA